MTKRKTDNLGFLPPEPDYKDTDYILGAATMVPFEELVPDGDWSKYKPDYEDQNHAGADKMDCVSESATSSVEFQINRMIREGIIETEPITDWLYTNEHGLRFECSQRYVAKLSGTTSSGNTQPRVGDAIRTFGIAPEKIWATPRASTYMSWEEYYKTVPATVIDKGKDLLKYFDITYQRLPDVKHATFKLARQQAPIWWAIGTCPGWGSADVIQACSMSPNHATLNTHDEELKYMGDWDSYDPYEKKLAWNYVIYYPYQLIVKPKPLILKKKDENENDMPTFYKIQGQPEIYQVGISGKYHHWLDADIFTDLYGDFSTLKIIEVGGIDPSKIGAPIGSSGSFVNRIISFFSQLRGGPIK